MHWHCQVWAQQRLGRELQDQNNVLHLAKPKKAGVVWGRWVPWLHEPAQWGYPSPCPLLAPSL